MDKLLNGLEVQKVAGEPVDIVSSSDFYKYKNINDLFNGSDKILILYQSNNIGNLKSGHWIALSKDNNNIYFYDPYGHNIDEHLKYIKFQYRYETNQIKNHLRKLLANSNYTIHYNPYEHQKMSIKPPINTCGRHAGMYLRFSPIDPEDYNKILLHLKKNLNKKSFDDLILLLTKFII